MKRRFSELAPFFDVAAVYSGRIGGVLVTLLFLPAYRSLLGTRLFGAAALVLALQAFFMMFDLGFATVVGRDFAAAGADLVARAKARLVWKRAEVVLFGGALSIAALLACGAILSDGWLGDPTELALAALLIITLVVINVTQVALTAIQRYVTSNAVTVSGTLARAIVTVVALRYFGPSMMVFLVAQLGCAMVHMVCGHILLARATSTGRPENYREILSLRGIGDLCASNASALFYTLAGALATNLDKPIIAAFVSLGTAGDYFLAATYAQTPIAILAGPISQYFMPKVIRSAARASAEDLAPLAMAFGTLTVCVLVAPVFLLSVYTPHWLGIWLGHAVAQTNIAFYARILLLGSGIGALGYFPSVYLIGSNNLPFLARLSGCLTIVLLPLVMLAAYHQAMVAIVVIYAAYNVASTALLWAKAAGLIGPRNTGRVLIYGYGRPLLLLGVVCLAAWGLLIFLPSEAARAWIAAATTGTVSVVATISVLKANRSLLSSAPAVVDNLQGA